MDTLILTLHIIVCILLIILVLLQSGKEGMGVIFGGGNTSLFGSSGAGGILAKLTTLMAVIFVITSLSYTYVTSSRPTTESEVLKVRIEEPAPATTPQQAAPAPETKAVPPVSQEAAPAASTPAQPTATAPAPAAEQAPASPAEPAPGQAAEPAQQNP